MNKSGVSRSESMWERELRAAIAALGPDFWASLSDASVDPRGAKSGIGAVLLSPTGQWVAETAKKGEAPTRDTRLAELWGVALGARLANEKGAKGTILALCDCQPAVEALEWARLSRGAAVSETASLAGSAGSTRAGAALQEPSGEAKEAALAAADALAQVGEWRAAWVPRAKLARSNDLARTALGLRPENRQAAAWGESSWRPQAPRKASGEAAPPPPSTAQEKPSARPRAPKP
jgi:hypothetical protein